MSQTPPLRRGFRSRTLAAIRLPLLAAALAVLLAASGLGTNGSISGDPGGRGGPPGATGNPLPPSVALPTPIRHVFVIYLENEGVDQIYDKVPFETHLANEYAWGGDALTHHMTGYYAVCHPSAPNYLAVTSGNSLQCGSDAYHNYTTERSLFNLLDTAGRTWRVYAESMPEACDLQSSGEYAVRHNPVPFFGNLGGDGSRSICRTHDLPLANLTKDYPYGSTPPNFTFIVPNLLNDGHDTGAAVADWFLSQFVSKLVNQTWFSTSAIFVTYDESFGSHPDSGYDGLDGGPVYLASVSPYSKGIGAVDATNASHYNLMSTIEWLLGLPGTGTGNDSTPAFPAMKGLFKFPNTTAYALSGMVIASGPREPIAGATVVVGGGPRTITGANGAFAVELANGSYAVTASAAGFVPSTALVEVSGSNATQDFTLVPRTYALTGTISNASSGTAIPRANVSVSNGPWTETNGSGGYQLSLANGTYSITVTAPGYGPSSLSATINGSALTKDLGLLPQSPAVYTVSGTVTVGANGTALPGANVTLVGVGTVTTGTTGAYSFQAPNGSYALRVTEPGFHAVDLPVVVSGADQLEDVPMSPVLYPWQAQVTSAVTQLPVPNAAVSISGGETATTDSAGQVEMALENGTYSVSVSATGYEDLQASVTILGAPLTQNFSLRRAPVFEVSGVVRYASNQSTVWNATVTGGPTGGFLTGENGTFWFWAVNGSYPLTAHKAGYVDQHMLVTVQGEPVNANFSLPGVTFPLAGVVSSGSSGAPVPGANVSLSPIDWVITPPSGEYSFLVGNGSYTVRINASGYLPASVRVLVHGLPVSRGVTLQVAPPSTGPVDRGGSVAGLWVALGSPLLGASAFLAAVLWLPRGRRGSSNSGDPRR